MEKMTIHRALSELKLIGSRIEKEISIIIPVGLMQKGGLVNGLYEKEKFDSQAKSNFQSVLDLITRRDKIKSAIVKANSNTFVKIANIEMTIADAINAKTAIVYKKKLVETLGQKLRQTYVQLEKNNAQVDANALNLAQAALQKKEVKITDTDVQNITKPYLDANLFVLVNPFDAENKINEIDQNISAFESEVDAVLSEINAITIIEF